MQRIEETLKHIFALKIPLDFGCEVLLINNSSSDKTVEVALAVYNNSKTDLPLTIIDEPKPGLTSARSRGIQQSKYDVVLFCDDDNHLDRNYLLFAKEILDRNPGVGILGGWAKPKLSFEPGGWIKDFYGALAIGKQASEDGVVKWVFGAGMLLRKNVLIKLKQQNIDLLLTDRTGTKQTSGGDTEICLLAKFIGYDVYYSSLLVFEHCISAERLTKKTFIKTTSENFYPVMFLFLLEKIVYNNGKSPWRLYLTLFFDRLYRILYFIPRCILGRHQFYSFISVYGNMLFTGWLIGNIRNFYQTFSVIKTNLGRNE